MQFLKDKKIDFLGKRGFTFVLSAGLVLLAIGLFFVKPPHWGIDFTGGMLIHLRFDEMPETVDVRSALERGGVDNAAIQEFRDASAMIIRIEEEVIEGDVDIVKGILRENLPEDTDFEVLRTEMVGPAVGSYIQERAMMAFFFAFIGIIIYVAWRFKGGAWGFTAVIALTHDIIITFGVLNLLGITIDLPVVAALLTLAGYSVNDTIVVYDRIRENIKLHYKKPFNEVFNLSINETLSRTVITSGTTLAVIFALLIRGGEVLHGFSVALFIGVIIGTYSSIFLAAPLVFKWYDRHKK